MKRVLCLLLCCSLFCITVLPTAAATYTDDMSSVENSNIRTFSGLVPIGQASNYPEGVAGMIRGGAAVTLPNRTQATGWVEYQVQNADTVTVGLYTQRGTFVSLIDGDTYALGVYQKNMSHLSAQQVVQAKFSAATSTLYSPVGSGTGKLAYNGITYVFLPTAQSAGSLVDYGINVYAGSGQGSLSRVSMSSSSGRITAMQYDFLAPYCYEEFTYSLPAGATRVRIELNDFTSVDILQADGTVVRQAANNKMRATLSFVAFSGSGLIIGRPEPVVSSSEGTSVQDSGSSSKSASSKPSGSASAPAGGAGSESAAKSSSGASKFQGQIVQSQPSGTGSGSKAATGSASAAENPIPPEQTQPEPEREAIQVLRVEPPAGDNVSFFLVLYIAGVCGLILLLLLGKRRR